MNAGDKIKIAAAIADKTLRTQLADGIRRHAGLDTQFFTSLREAAGAAAEDGSASVLLFDAAPVTDDESAWPEWRSKPELLALAIAVDEKQDVPAGFPGPNFFTRPLRLGLLLDRIIRHATMRRGRSPSFALGKWVMSPDDGTLTDEKNGTVVRLTEKERDILVKLRAANGQTIDRRELLDAIWGYAESIETHTLETHIYRLRRKIENDPARPDWLLTEETGYRLAL